MKGLLKICTEKAKTNMAAVICLNIDVKVGCPDSLLYDANHIAIIFLRIQYDLYLFFNIVTIVIFHLHLYGGIGYCCYIIYPAFVDGVTGEIMHTDRFCVEQGTGSCIRNIDPQFV